MNRKQKIIVSTTGIFLVLLILVGLTYAYFLTRINGNTNEKSISVTTANLELKYADIEQILISEENVEPGKTWTKKFSATNTGSKKIESYGVALENVINTLERTEDLVYTLNCTSSLGTDCNKVEAEQEFPVVGKILITNSIESKEVQSYELTITYKEQNIDQSVDMNKQFSAKVNLANPSTFGALGSGTLASAIIENGASVKVGDTELKSTKIIKNVIDIGNSADGSSWSDEVNDFTNDGIFRLLDDYGMSYFFRGPIVNNYINFADMCWRIVRISGYGSIKLVLEDQDNTCETSDGNWDIPTTTGGTTKTGNFGYTEYAKDTLISSSGKKNPGIRRVHDYLNGNTNSDNSMATAFYNFQTNTLSNYLSSLKSGDWCLNERTYIRTNGSAPYTFSEITKDQAIENIINLTQFDYDSFVRLTELSKNGYNPMLKCNGTNVDKFGTRFNNETMYVGTLTADEVAYAGGVTVQNTTYNYYLLNDYQKNNNLISWTISPRSYYGGYDEGAYRLRESGQLSDVSVQRSGSFRPAINLKSAIKIINGDGTKENPYTVKLAN